MPRRRHLLLLLFAPACSSSPDHHPRRVCTPGATQWCACPAQATGVQICSIDGSTWGPCIQCSKASPPAGDGAPPVPADLGLPPPTPDGSASSVDGPPQTGKPIMFAAGHYLKHRSQLFGLGPFIVYGWAADPALGMYSQQIQQLGQIQDSGVEKWLMYSSVKTVQAKLSDQGHVAQLKSAGITGLGYNSEGDKTPASEMQNPTQAVSQFAQLAQQNGFEAVWGPIRTTAEQTSNAAYGQMINAGLDGVGLQEQKWIENSCAGQRAAAVKGLSVRLKQLSGAFQVQVQVMPSRCLNGDGYAAKQCGTSGPKFHHCQDFGDQIAPAVDSMAIWASSPADNADLVALIRALRHK